MEVMKLNRTIRVHDKANRADATAPINSPPPVKTTHNATQYLADEDRIVRQGALDDGSIKDKVTDHRRRAQFVCCQSGSLLPGGSSQHVTNAPIPPAPVSMGRSGRDLSEQTAGLRSWGLFAFLELERICSRGR